MKISVGSYKNENNKIKRKVYDNAYIKYQSSENIILYIPYSLQDGEKLHDVHANGIHNLQEQVFQASHIL